MPKKADIKDTNKLVIQPASSALRMLHKNKRKAIPMLFAIDRTSGVKLFSSSLQERLDETKLIYKRPVTRGVTTDFDTVITLIESLGPQLQWDKIREQQDSTVIMPLHPFTPRQIVERYGEIFFQKFGFKYFQPVLSQQVVFERAHRYLDYENDGIIIDSSDSATHLGIIENGILNPRTVRRIDVGGRLISALLKDTISFRYFDLKDSQQLIYQIKEETAFVSLNFNEDMRRAKGFFKRGFVLPDLDLNKRGYAVDNCQGVFADKIQMDKERFQFMETLFSPGDCGINQQGLIEALQGLVNSIPPENQKKFLRNIVLTGGNTRAPLFVDRLALELRKFAPSYIQPRIMVMNDQWTSCQSGFVSVEEAVSRSQFQQRGYQCLINIF